MSTENSIETEVKISVSHWTLDSATRHLTQHNFTVTIPRLFEANFVFDDERQSIRGSQMLLRLRRVADRIILTWKGPSLAGPHKSRPEIEVQLDSFDNMRHILENLGYRTYFRYEKWRTEFGAPNGTITFDETPIGNFLELEGRPEWIDETASQLGFTPRDYVLESYGRLYLTHCEKAGMQPLNMVFPSSA